MKGDRAFSLTGLDSLMAKFFHRQYLLFLISAIFRGKIGVKVGSKTQTLGMSCLCRNSSFKML